MTGTGKKARRAPVTSQEPSRADVVLGTCTAPWHERVISHPGHDYVLEERMLRWSLACSGVVMRVCPEDSSCAGEGGSPAVMGADQDLELKLPHTVPLHGAEMAEALYLCIHQS